MEILEQLQMTINQYSDKNWYVIRVEQTEVDSKYMLKMFRSVHSSSKGVFGIPNIKFFKRYIDGGFHLTYMMENTGVILIFCMGKKELDKSNFLRHYKIRYHNSTKHIPTKMSIEPVKPNKENNLFQVMMLCLEGSR